MATNKEKYQTICNRVVLTRGSWALERFVEDAIDHHMDDQTGKLVALRLTEYYELLDRLKVFPGGLAMLSPFPGMETFLQGTQPQPQGNGTASPPTGHGQKKFEDDEDEDEDEHGGPGSGTNVADTSFDDDIDNQWSSNQ